MSEPIHADAHKFLVEYQDNKNGEWYLIEAIESREIIHKVKKSFFGIPWYKYTYSVKKTRPERREEAVNLATNLYDDILGSKSIRVREYYQGWMDNHICWKNGRWLI